MIEAAMIWNEPNNKSHWDPELDPDWARFAEMAIGWPAQAIRGRERRACRACSAASRRSIPAFVAQHGRHRACSTHVDVVAVHGFPLDWNHWQIDEWPAKLDEIRAVTDLPIWVSEVGVSTLRRRGGAGVGASSAPPSC